MSNVTLINIKGKSHFCSGIFSIGAYIHNQAALLIDSGSDEKSAKDALDALERENYSVKAIINTHCHPDHCGGNHFFQKKFPELRIYAAHDEKEFIENPKLAPRCFCGLAAPFAGLQNKHIGPQKPSLVTDVIAPYHDQTIRIDDNEFQIITLAGHTPGSIGIITEDNILYSGDALFGQATFSKHPLLFYTDIDATLESFSKLASLQVNACVLYHGGVINNLPEVAAVHKTRILEIKQTIFNFIRKEPLSVDSLTQKMMQLYQIPNSMVAYVLSQTTLRAYLTHLEKEKSIQLIVQDGLLQAIAQQ
jgi:glyoxylase-like metal-dependent hydrolase (beta-lactamase superfamily II)